MIELFYALSVKVLTVIGALIAFFYVLESTFRTSKPGDMPKEESDADLPSIYVNEDLLRHALIPRATLPEAEDHETADYNSLAEFEVYRMDSEDMYCSTPSGSEEAGDEDDQVSELPVTLQPVPNGYIVNGNCYLSWQQWNTMVIPAVSKNLLHCVVCGQYCEVDAGADHVATACHRRALQASPPIDKFDLSIARKIRNLYHCAVCNETFDVSSESEHFGGKIHGGNVLFSINKASDLLDRSDPNLSSDKKHDTYHFKTHAMNSPTGRSESSECNDNLNFINFQNKYYCDEYEEEAPLFTGLSYATMAKKPKVNTEQFIDIDLGNKNVTVRYDSWNMVISPDPKSNRFWCMVCRQYGHMRTKREHCEQPQHKMNLTRCTVVEAYEDYFIRQVDDKLYHCGHCNNLQLIHEMVDHVESVHPRRKPIAESKNIINSPRKFKLNSDTDSAIKNTINAAQNTINAAQNTMNAAKNTVNVTNNLINVAQNTINVPKDTINVPKDTINVTKNTNNDSPKKQPTGENNAIFNKNTIQPQSPNNNDKKPVLNTRNDATNNGTFNGLIHKMPGIFDDIVIYPFGCKITVSSLAYNVCCKRPTDLYCGLCDEVCLEAAMAQHLYGVRHLELLQRTPFIAPFSFNLIRAIRDALHCAICNIPVSAASIYAHIEEKPHKDSLNTALNQPPKLPPIGVKIPNVPETLPTQIPNMGPTQKSSPNSISSPVNQSFGPKFSPTKTPNFRPTQNLSPNSISSPVNQGFGPKFSPTKTPNFRPTQNLSPNSISSPVNQGFGPKFSPTKTPNFRPTQNLSPNSISSPVNQGFGPKFSPTKAPNFRSKQHLSPNSINAPVNEGFGPNLSPINTPNVNLGYNVNNVNKVKNVNIAKKLFNNEQVTDNIANNTQETTSNKEDYDIKDIEYDTESDNVEIDEKERTFDSTPSDASMDQEEHVYIKLKNTYIKIANTAYNTLVHVGDGSRYCFVCSTQVQYVELQKHVDGRSHMENMESCRFLDIYGDHLLRQIYLTYHCAICNVIISPKELKTHLEWPTHTLQNITMKNIKKTRKTEIKGGVKQIVVSTQNDIMYVHDHESKIKIRLNVQITDKSPKVEGAISNEGFSRKNKIIFFNDIVLKVSWDNWHAISKIKNGYKCLLCQKELKMSSIDVHCASEWHRYGLDKPFEKQYGPALIRKINDSTLNCLFCNTEVSNKPHLMQVHTSGKRHTTNYEAILKDSSLADTYTDCHDDALTL